MLTGLNIREQTRRVRAGLCLTVDHHLSGCRTEHQIQPLGGGSGGLIHGRHVGSLLAIISPKEHKGSKDSGAEKHGSNAKNRLTVVSNGKRNGIVNRHGCRNRSRWSCRGWGRG